MRAALAAVALLAATGSATAAQDEADLPVVTMFKVSLPEGWERHDKLSAISKEHVGKAGHFAGEVLYQSGADSFAPADGLVFHVTWAGALEPVKEPAAAIRSELDRAKQLWCGSGERRRLDWREQLDGGVGSSRIEWAQDDDGTVTIARTLSFASGEGKPRVVTAECVMRADMEETYRPLCARVVDTLAIAVPEADRMELTKLPASAVGDGCPGDAVAAVEPPAGGTATPGGGATIGEPGAGAGGPVLYTGEGDGGGGGDKKMWLLAGAVLLVIAVYVTTRGRRDDEVGDGDGDGDGDGNGNGGDDDEDVDGDGDSDEDEERS